MNTLALHSVYHPKDPARRYKGIAVVIGLHITIGYGIIAGTTGNGLVAIKQRIEMVVPADIVIPPPPPKPPTPIEKPRVDATKQDTFVQAPDMASPVTSPVVIESTAVLPVEPVAIIQPQQQVAQALPKIITSDLRVACPTQAAPVMPRKAIQEGSEGVVRASALIRDGVIKDITILSGPRVFHSAVRDAMLQYKCTASSGEVVATQEFVFKLE